MPATTDHAMHGENERGAHGTHTGHITPASKPAHNEQAAMDHSAHKEHQGHAMLSSKEMAREGHAAHSGHGTDHTAHEQMFRVRFWWPAAR